MSVAKKIAFAVASLALIGLLGYGKYRLAFAKPTLVLLFLAGLVFAISTPAQADATTLEGHSGYSE